MATNLFEKYGIKDVADVTIYRIEKKEQTYESQRKVSVASILKGAVEVKTVYPFKDGKSDEEGFEAYVFTNADVHIGANYDCDDEGHLVIRSYRGRMQVIGARTNKTTFTVATSITGRKDSENNPIPWNGLLIPTDLSDLNYSKTGFQYDTSNPASVAGLVQNIYPNDIETVQTDNWAQYTIVFTLGEYQPGDQPDNGVYPVTFTAVSKTYIPNDETTAELHTGYVGTRPAGADEVAVADANKYPGTHEYSYAQQAFMLFAKRQNLIGVTGTRYNFTNADELMGTLTFEDCYALAPNSSERVVVLGPASGITDDRGNASWTDADYNIDEINDLLAALTTTFTAKAYDVTYGTYAELVVEDEMGYFNPKFLGMGYDKATQKVINPYSTYFTSQNIDKKDVILGAATMWGEDIHFSINDAIDALKQELKRIDSDSSSSESIKNIYGGYRMSTRLDVGETDLDTNDYSFYKAGVEGNAALGTSQYSLSRVMDALTSLAYIDGVSGSTIGVDYAENKESNRAIYINIGGANVAANSYIYLLHNKNYRKLASDTEGVFTFADKKGNKVYYQDKIFAKTEWLAIVIVGQKGYVFVVNRNGSKDVTKVAWMISDNDFVKDKDTKSLVANGLIHTTDITIDNETFEATCAVKKLSIRKTVKTTNRYVPVLFLDTLKVSTIEQTAEDVYATGGHGNSNLIGWDFGKAITLNIQDALFTPASMSAILGSYDGSDFRKGVKETKTIDRSEKVIAPRSFIVPAGNQNGTPTEADKTAQAVYIDLNTMEPYPDGTPIAEGETYLKWTRSIAYEGQSLGKTIEISADKFPGTYKIVGDTFIKAKDTGEEQRFQFIVPQAKFQTEQTITLEADGEPSVFDMNMTVLKPDDGVMVRFVQYDVIENTEENDGSTMVKGTENLNLLDDAELYRVDTAVADEEVFIGATEY